VPWIESHTNLARHPKTIRFAKLLGLSLPEAIGYLHLLWWWALEYAQDGRLSGYDANEVAAALLWQGPPEQLRDALIAARFLDKDGHIHDWEDYAGRLIDKRRADADRLRRYRDSQKSVTRPPREASLEGNAYETRTYEVPYLANRTGPTGPEYVAASAATPHTDPSAIQEIFEHYKRRIQPHARGRPDAQIRARLKTWSPDEVRRAIDHFADDAWEMANNAHRGAAWFFKDAGRLESYVHMTPRKETPDAGPRPDRHGGVPPAGGASRAARRRPGERVLTETERERLRALGHPAGPRDRPGPETPAPAAPAGAPRDRVPAAGP
jgi:hypothetical protein